MTLEQLYEHAMSAASGLFLQTGVLHRMYLCEDAKGNIFPLMPPPNLDKDVLALALRHALKEFNVVRYACMAEVWMLSLPNLSARQTQATLDAAYGQYGTLEHHPDRIEAVSVIVEERGRSITGYFQILRPEHGPPKLAPASEKSTIGIGRMIGLLDETRH